MSFLNSPHHINSGLRVSEFCCCAFTKLLGYREKTPRVLFSLVFVTSTYFVGFFSTFCLVMWFYSSFRLSRTSSGTKQGGENSLMSSIHLLPVPSPKTDVCLLVKLPTASFLREINMGRHVFPRATLLHLSAVAVSVCTVNRAVPVAWP